MQNHQTKSSDQEQLERNIRVEKLKRELYELAGGNILLGQSDDRPPELFEKFLLHVRAIETADTDTYLNRLSREGINLPPPEELNDPQLTDKLWEVIHALAQHRIFLEFTDHLSDRDLYAYLWQTGLREPSAIIPADNDSATHLDILGNGSEEQTYLYLKYHADEISRNAWARDLPNYQLPAHNDPPYDRDHRLPKP